MSLDVYLTVTKPTEVYGANITHNLNRMAREAGVYKHLWRPEEIGIATAEQLIKPLQQSLIVLGNDPERFRAFNPSNGWGTYEVLVEFISQYLAACVDNPDAEVRVWR